MKCVQKYIPAKFIRRPNRFLAIVELETTENDNVISHTFEVHVPDPGRLKELLVPGADVVLRPTYNTKRKTKFTLVGVKYNDIWVNIDSQITNKLFQEDFSKIKSLAGYRIKQPEFSYGKSRIDFLIEHLDTKKQALVEIKSVTLVKGKLALFPDAPTKRGLKHVLELTNSLKSYHTAFIVFIIKRNDAERFSPNYNIDPDLARALIMANSRGVNMIAVKCLYDPIETQTLSIIEEVKIDLAGIPINLSHPSARNKKR